MCCRHPDKNKDPEAGDNFVKINEAYEVNTTSKLLSTQSDVLGE